MSIPPALRSLASRVFMWWHTGTPRLRYERIHLRGDGFTLRPFRPADLPRLLEIVQDPDIVRFSYLPRSWRTEEGARGYIDSLPGLAARGRKIDLAIESQGSGKLIGHAALREISWSKRWAGVATWIAPDAREAGVAAMALSLISEWAFSELGMVRSEGDPDLDNVAAHRMLERAGFSREETVGPEVPGGRTIALFRRFRKGPARRRIPVLKPIRYSID